MRPHKKIEAINAQFRATLAGGYDGDKPWSAVRYLRLHGNRFIFEKAAAWCVSQSPYKRARGADILCQLRAPKSAAKKSRIEIRFPNPIFVRESFEILSRLVTTESDEQALESALFGLGHLYEEAAVPFLIPFANHPSDEIRFAVACSLGHFSQNSAAVEALIPLTSDSDAEVRDWATFGIGNQSDADYPELREALYQRLNDTSPEVREEAIAGLAKRKDPRAVVPLFKLMKRGSYFVVHDHGFETLLDLEESDRDRGPDEYIDALYEKFPELLPARRAS